MRNAVQLPLDSLINVRWLVIELVSSVWVSTQLARTEGPAQKFTHYSASFSQIPTAPLEVPYLDLYQDANSPISGPKTSCITSVITWDNSDLLWGERTLLYP